MNNIYINTIEFVSYANSENPILEVRICYPQIEGSLSQKNETQFNYYYSSKAFARKEYVDKQLLPLAKKAYRASAEQNGFFSFFSYKTNVSTTFISDKTASLFTDITVYTGERNSRLKRVAQTWDLLTGKKLHLSDMLKDKTKLRQILKKQIQNSDKSFDTETMLKNYSDSNFYLRNDGLIFFWQPRTVAPLYKGIQEIILPLSDF